MKNRHMDRCSMCLLYIIESRFYIRVIFDACDATTSNGLMQKSSALNYLNIKRFNL